MTDVPGDTSTTVFVTVGSTTNGDLELIGDHDWYKVNLTAGQQITVTINGVTLEDPYLYIHNSAGAVIYENDDINPGIIRDSRLTFTANYTGVYYIDVGAWDADAGGPGDYAGTYQLVVSNFASPPLASVDTIANQLVNGYWGGPSQSHHFNVTQGGTITVNLTALTAAGQNLALAALNLWSDVIGVTFQQVSSGGQIIFDDNQSGAFTSDNWTGHITDVANVNVSTQWLIDNGTGLNSYSFQTYIHEIGHALGLGHAGDYNITATYPDDALFQNDAWSTSIMSYFSPQDNTYFAGQGFTDDFAVTPMMADIAAMQTLYGLSTTTRTGNTTYGFNSNADRDVYKANLYPHVSYTIFDSGGIDTLDYSGFANNQLINLNPETFSNVGPGIGNVSVGRGVVIENAIGGAGHDTLIGNFANNVLDGRGGVNTISYAAATAGVTLDTSIAGPQNTIGAGVDTLLNYNTLVGSPYNDTLTASYFQNGQILIYAGAGNDVLIADSRGSTLSGEAGDDWFVDGGGNDNFAGGDGFDTVDYSHLGAGVVLGGAGADGFDTLNSIEQMVGSNFDDLLSGASVLNGGAGNDVITGGAGGDTLTGGTGTDSLTGGSGADTFRDTKAGLNGDTISDFTAGDKIILTDATLAGFSFNLSVNTLTYTGGSLTLSNVPAGTIVARAAAGGGVELTIQPHDPNNDFNGDGRSDLLWRNTGGLISESLGQPDGGFAGNAPVTIQVPTDWHIAGIGDFNGDGKDDILWRHTSGLISESLGQPNGGFAGNAPVTVQVPTDWAIAAIGDFNGDGRDDILWRHTSGLISESLGQPDGGFQGNAPVTVQVPTDWSIAATGDFNGDGKDDILWRHTGGLMSESLGQPDGGFQGNAPVTVQVSTDWNIATIGDFNGDGKDDILWRHTSGLIGESLGQPDGGFAGNANVSIPLGTGWHVAATGDYNGDGRDDVMLRNDNGQIAQWLGQSDGSLAVNAAININPGPDWHLQDPYVYDLFA